MAEVISAIMENLVVPLIVAIAGIVITLASKYLEKFSAGIELKNSLYSLEKQVSIKNKIIEILSSEIKSAVASQMSSANEMKEANGGKLTTEQQEALRTTAKLLVTKSLSALLSSNESLMEMLGGEEAVEELIDTLIEKYVYEYKIAQAGTIITATSAETKTE